jgi:hypothetical protein
MSFAIHIQDDRTGDVRGDGGEDPTSTFTFGGNEVADNINLDFTYNGGPKSGTTFRVAARVEGQRMSGMRTGPDGRNGLWEAVQDPCPSEGLQRAPTNPEQMEGDLAYNKPIYGRPNPSNATMEANCANDGDNTTEWDSGLYGAGGPPRGYSLTVDLEAPTTLSRVFLLEGNHDPCNHANTFMLSGSVDNATFVDVQALGATLDGTVDEPVAPAPPYRWWRVLATSDRGFSNGGCGLVIRNYSLFGAVRTACGEWSLRRDFMTGAAASNTSPDQCGYGDVWAYEWDEGGAANLAAYHNLDNYVGGSFGIDGLEGWVRIDPGAPREQLPAVRKNTTGRDQDPTGTTIHWPAGAINMQPHRYGPSPRPAVATWVSPISGSIVVSGGVRDMDAGCGNGILWSLSKQEAHIATGEIDNGGEQRFDEGLGAGALVNLPIARGEAIGLIIDPHSSDSDCDSTEVDFNVSIAGTPPPNDSGPHWVAPTPPEGASVSVDRSSTPYEANRSEGDFELRADGGTAVRISSIAALPPWLSCEGFETARVICWTQHVYPYAANPRIARVVFRADDGLMHADRALSVGDFGTAVGLGDSYSAGEGAVPFDYPSLPQPPFGFKGGTAGGRNQCHRSPYAYFPQLVGANGKFFACSGAILEDLFSANASAGNGAHSGGDPLELAQIEHVTPADGLITLSLSGNDLGFAEVAEECVMSRNGPQDGEGGLSWNELGALNPIGLPVTDCRFDEDRKVGDVIKRIYEAGLSDTEPTGTRNEQPTLYDALRALRTKAPRARILILGYPQFFGDPQNEYQQTLWKCGVARYHIGGVSVQPRLGFSPGDRVWTDKMIAEANAHIRAIATRFGAEYVDVTTAMKDHYMCSDNEPYIQPIYVAWLFSGKILGDRAAQEAGAFSAHPSMEGQKQFLDRIQTRMLATESVYPLSLTAGTAGAVTLDLPNSETATLKIAWNRPVRGARFTLIDPNGRVITPVVDAAYSDYPRVVTEYDFDVMTTLTIPHPTPGRWTLMATANPGAPGARVGRLISVADEPIEGEVTVATAPEPPSNPIAILTERTVSSGDGGRTVAYDASPSQDERAAIATYLWDFGDGDVANGVQVTHSFKAGHAYAPTLTITDDQGQQAFAAASVIDLRAGAPSLPSTTTERWKWGAIAWMSLGSGLAILVVARRKHTRERHRS